MNIQTILTHYLFCALWTAELEGKLDTENATPETVANSTKDIESFVAQAGDLLKGMNEEQIGHDFWLTRNGHGAGFWDRGLGETGKKLTELCKTFKEKNVFKVRRKFIIE